MPCLDVSKHFARSVGTTMEMQQSSSNADKLNEFLIFLNCKKVSRFGNLFHVTGRPRVANALRRQIYSIDVKTMSD